MSERKYYCLCSSNCRYETMNKEQILAAITQAVENGSVQDVDTGFVTKIKETNAGGYVSFWVGTTAQYNALANRDASCVYILTDETVDIEKWASEKFALINHNHDEAYSPKNHNHDNEYSFGQEREFDSGEIKATEYTHSGNKSHFYTILICNVDNYNGGVPITIDWKWLTTARSSFWVSGLDGNNTYIQAYKDDNGCPHFEIPASSQYFFKRIVGYY